MPDRTVSVSVVAQMSNYLAGMQRGSSATAALGKQAQTTGQLTQQFIGKVGGSISKLGNQVGGEFGLVLTTVGDDIEKVSAKSVRLSTALQVGGGAAIAAGLGLQQLGSGAVQATDQLDAAITASGESVSDYSKKIDDAVTSNENLGKSAEDTKQALATLIPAAGSTQGALDQMGVVTNLAAAKHESLATAATAVARILGGNGSRTLSVYGVHMDGIGSKTDQAKRALDQLAQKLDGQASASIDNFSGQVGIATTHVVDFIKDAAGPLGNVLSIAGGAAEVAGTAFEFFTDRKLKNSIAQTALTAAQVGGTAATVAQSAAIAEQTGLLITDEATIQALVESNVAFATSADGVTVAIAGEGAAAATTGASMKGLGAAAGLGGAAIAGALAIGVAEGTSALLSLSDAALQNKIVFDKASDAASAYNKQVQLINTGVGASSAKKRAAALNVTSGVNGAVLGGFASLGLGGLNPTFESSSSSIQKIDASLTSLVAGGHFKEAATEYDKWTSAAKQFGISQDDVQQAFPSYNASLVEYGSNTKSAATSTADLGSKFSVTAQNAANLKETTDELEKSLSNFGATEQTVEGTTEGYYSALDAANKAIKDNGKNIDDSTAKGRANNQTLYALAKSADDLAAANLKAKVPIDQVKAALDGQRQTFIDTAQKMGYTAQAAQDLATKLIGVTTTKYNFTLNGITIATNDLNTYLKALDKIPGKVSTSFVITPGSGMRASANGNMFDYGGRASAYANGGFPTGIYQGRAGGIQKFAEPETGWELYVSGKQSQRARNQSLLMQGAARLGMLGGAQAPTYMRAPSSPAGQTLVVTVNVPVSQSLIGNEDFLAKSLTTIVQKGVTSGVVSAGWNNH